MIQSFLKDIQWVSSCVSWDLLVSMCTMFLFVHSNHNSVVAQWQMSHINLNSETFCVGCSLHTTVLVTSDMVIYRQTFEHEMVDVVCAFLKFQMVDL